VLRTAARFTAVLALCFAFGFQWLALQSIAWTSMILQNAKQTSLCEAMKRTFDGAHPCSLCHIVNKGKTSQNKRDVKSSPKIDIIGASQIARLLPLVIPFQYELSNSSFTPSADLPAVPPPRTDLIS